MDPVPTRAPALPGRSGTPHTHRHGSAPLRGLPDRAAPRRGPAAFVHPGRPCRTGIDCVTMPPEDAMNPVLARFLQTLAPERVTMLRGQEQGLAALLEQLCGDDTRLAEARAARLPEGDVIDGLRQIRADDVRLVCAATDGDPEALTRVDTLLAAEVNAAAASVRAQAGLADEVKQRLREQLLV